MFPSVIMCIIMSHFVKSCAWEPSSVLQLKRMLPSFSPQIGRWGWIPFVKSVISKCLILLNHAQESLLQYFSSNGCCLHFPPKLVHVSEFPLWNQSYHVAFIFPQNWNMSLNFLSFADRFKPCRSLCRSFSNLADRLPIVFKPCRSFSNGDDVTLLDIRSNFWRQMQRDALI